MRDARPSTVPGAAMSVENTTLPDLAAHQLEEEKRTANGIYGIIVGTGVMAASDGDGPGTIRDRS